MSAASALLLLGGCSIWPERSSDELFGLVTPYRMEIVQGNVVTQEQVALAKPGMSRNQVRGLLGSPMLTDPFHADRWDYTFTIRRQGTEPQKRSVVAFFSGDRLERIEAPDLPSEREFVASIARRKLVGDPPPLVLTDAQKQALPKPEAAPAPADAASAPRRSYPPLEPT